MTSARRRLCSLWYFGGTPRAPTCSSASNSSTESLYFHDLKYPADYTHLDYLNPNAPKGGELVLATQSAFNTLAPMAERGIGVPAGFGFNSDTLLIRAGDEVTAFYGRLANGIAVTDDRLTMVFRIHPDVKWRDGVPITSRDVAFTLDARRNQPQGRMW